jgi:hypothetical protein
MINTSPRNPRRTVIIIATGDVVSTTGVTWTIRSLGIAVTGMVGVGVLLATVFARRAKSRSIFYLKSEALPTSNLQQPV